MKKIIGILALSLVFALSSNAQQKKQRKHKRAEFTPEQIATLQSKKMALHFDLNTTQQKEVYNLMKVQATDRKGKMAEFKQRKEKGIKPSDAEKFEFQNNILDKKITRKAEMKKILNQSQFEKWEKMQRLKMKKGKKELQRGKRGAMNQQKRFKK